MRQLFTAASPDEAFTDWCKRELDKYNSDVDGILAHTHVLVHHKCTDLEMYFGRSI